MATLVKSFAIQGIDSYVVDIETKIMEGQPLISIIGLGDQAVREAAERIQSAIDESGYEFPKKKVIISLAPSDKKKSGSYFDLSMEIGVLQQAMKSIEEKGLLLSEYPPGTSPTKHHFPKRNRIIASWSEQLVVIAAGKKSGAMITANYANQYRRNVEIVI